MSFAISWSELAKEKYAETLQYIESEYGLEAALKFMDATDNVLASISMFPKIFSLTDYKNLRRAVITKQTSLYYLVLDDEVELVIFWDNRQSGEGLIEVLGG